MHVQVHVHVHGFAMTTAGRARPLAALGLVTSTGPRFSPPPWVSLGYGSPGCTAGEDARDRFPEPPGGLLRGAADWGTIGASDTAGSAHSAVAATATRSGMPAT